jgi:hypothetical protein
MTTRVPELVHELKALRPKPAEPPNLNEALACGHYPGQVHDWRCRELERRVDHETREAFARLTRAIAALLAQREAEPR